MKWVEDFTYENALLKREITVVKEKQDSLNGTVETLQHQLRLCQDECTSLQADWDVLEARVAELQEVQRPQKRDLTSLHL